MLKSIICGEDGLVALPVKLLLWLEIILEGKDEN